MPAPQPYGPPPGYAWPPARTASPYYPAPGRAKNSRGIVSLVFGVLGRCFPLVLSIVAVITGHLSRRAQRHGEADNGSLGTAGLVLGDVGVALGLRSLWNLLTLAGVVDVRPAGSRSVRIADNPSERHGDTMAGQSLRTEASQGGITAAQEPKMGTMRPPQVPPPTNHGRTRAAWSVTVIVVAGFTVAGLGMIFALLWLFWAGLGLAVIGVIVGGVLRAAGYGQGGQHTSTASHH